MSKKMLTSGERNKLIGLLKGLLEGNAEAPIQVSATAITITADGKSAVYRRRATPVRKERSNL